MTAKKALKSEIETGLDVGIGVTNPSEKLVVNGVVKAKTFKLDPNIADYVFENNYKLRNLEEVEGFILKNKHLPNFKSEKAYKKQGAVDVAEFQKTLQELAEEHTLYLIKQNKENTAQTERINVLEKENQQLKTKLTSVEQENLKIKTRLDEIENMLQMTSGKNTNKNNQSKKWFNFGK